MKLISSALIFCFSMIFILLGNVFALDNDAFLAANELYKDADYLEAKNAYLQLMGNNKNYSYELFYNTGNACLKSNDLVNALVNYKRAQRYKPRRKDLIKNLQYARDLVVYKISKPKDVRKYNRLLYQGFKYVTFKDLFYLLLVLLLVFMLLKNITVFSNKSKLLRFLKRAVIVLFALLLMLILSKYYLSKPEVVVKINDAQLKNASVESATDLFKLPIGIELVVLDENENWYKVRLSNYEVGWILKSQVSLV